MSRSDNSNRKTESRIEIFDNKDRSPLRGSNSIQTGGHSFNEVAVCSSCGGIFHSDQFSLYFEIYELPDDFELLCPKCATGSANRH